MMRRWKQELLKHSPHSSFGPKDEENVRYIWGVKQTGPYCHCEKGPGSVRKNHVYGCNTSDCMCKMGKNWGKDGKKKISFRYGRQRHNDKAIEDSFRDNGLYMLPNGKMWLEYNIGDDYFTDEEIDLDIQNIYFLEEYLQGLEASRIDEVGTPLPGHKMTRDR